MINSRFKMKNKQSFALVNPLMNIIQYSLGVISLNCVIFQIQMNIVPCIFIMDHIGMKNIRKIDNKILSN